ncbi:phospho-sugar mutase [Fructilactobacillus fructivorans]|uniref:Phosphoglucomutase n=1 Tax=Fructilactobacillus fructivorans TaxID=1614 RepID=A0AAE6TWB2_9LACO|nr:phospho-sugar mutase [Fructilactobacillus fructivorans]KRK58266.1 phosphoglucomutase phosphomannomutase alpha beta alpha domain I [Fructilactobacillus fructivorans]KRN40856.1 phosphoglucomutase phosphomannomutase alpha beta alpha domain I [Fructilactobacillus fructivorans]QFX92248.1 phospho-sugar mutase [Fructilactobacillus fructivorans]RDV65298.1 phospho-sugar mutase [Fructilactobacillus fructivorans]
MSSTDTKKEYLNWVSQEDMPAELKIDLAKMRDNPDQIEDAFGSSLSFGTAGMRGTLGAGTNRMNVYTVRQATEGLAQLMDTLDPKVKKRGVVISFDPRYNSQLFAHEAARVLGAHGIKTFVFDDIRPTPELSFAVRHLNTYAGIMITASHNPKQYNGYKIYGEDGGQMPPKESDLMTTYVRKVDDLFKIPVSEEKDLRNDNLMSIVGENVDVPYLQAVQTVNVNHDLINKVGKDLKFVYTPLHGTGKIIARRALSDAGFKNYDAVVEQTIADPEFPTTPFPNPEFPQTFDLAIQLGKKEDADVLIATDPDADRLGAAVRQPNGEYKLMTGNQIASVLLNYILQAKKDAGDLPKDGVVVKSIVSTELATDIAKNYGVEMKDVLTGFKFIAEQIKNFEQNQDHTFLFGFEESYGYLIKPFVRDKDAIQSTLLLAEVAAYYKEKGMTLYDGLQEIYKKYGYFREKTISKEFDGLEGKSKMAAIMKNFRDHPMTSFNGAKVVKLEDFQTSTTTMADGSTQKIDLPQSNVLKYWLDDGTWLAIRPSGTEPKIKFYIGVKAGTAEAADKKLQSYVKAVDDELLNQ